MKPWLHLVWLVPLVAFGVSWAWQASRPPVCADFLTNAGIRHEALKFRSCEPGHEAQIPALIARYEVSGEQAAIIEAQLEKHYGMAPLKFVCCGWEPANGGRGQARDERGHSILVGMNSEETIWHSRADWPKIKVFTVQVSLLLEEP